MNVDNGLLSRIDAEKIRGLFYEYEYQRILERNEHTEHFGCFKNNNTQIFVQNIKIYFHDDKYFDRFVQETDKGIYQVYSYIPLGKTDCKRLTAVQVFERIFNKENNYRMPYYMQQCGDYIS